MDSQFDHQFNSYVISLKRTPQQLEEFRARNSKCGSDFCHFEGIDHRDIDLVAAANEITAKGTTLKPGSIGAAMSHLALWRRCAGQTKHFVVLEDDAQARNDIKARLLETVGKLDEFDIVLMGCNTDRPLELSIAPGFLFGGGFSVPHPTAKHLSEFAESANPVGLHRLNMSMGICGYVISPKGAKVLIRECFPIDHRPVRFASWNHTFPSQGIDDMMGTLYSRIAAYTCVAQLVMTSNDPATSLTINK